MFYVYILNLFINNKGDDKICIVCCHLLAYIARDVNASCNVSCCLAVQHLCNVPKLHVKVGVISSCLRWICSLSETASNRMYLRDAGVMDAVERFKDNSLGTFGIVMCICKLMMTQ